MNQFLKALGVGLVLGALTVAGTAPAHTPSNNVKTLSVLASR